MGLIETVTGGLFGGGRNMIRETVEVFRENSEAEAKRSHANYARSLHQFAVEFDRRQKGGFDRFMDGVNRVPRPALALGTIGLLASAMVAPEWFAARMAGLALVPEPLWWLLGVVVSFYFGARYQVKGQQFQQHLADTLTYLPKVNALLADVEPQKHALTPEVAATFSDAKDGLEVLRSDENRALDEWKRKGSPP